jgi:hypothetical protein
MVQRCLIEYAPPRQLNRYVAFLNQRMMRLLTTLCLSFVVVVVCSTTCSADAGTMTLAEMIKYSDLVIVGKVVNVTVNGKRIADVAVTQTLKGDRSLTRIRFYAFPIWTCDVSAAEQNETGIFFLRSHFTDDSAEKTAPQDKLDGIPVFFLTHSGRGRLIFQHVDGDDFVYANKRGDVKFPGSLHFARRPKSDNPDLGLIKVADVIAYVRSRV